MKKCEIQGGATLWARQTIDSEIFYDKPDKWFKIWFYLVNRVNHKKKRKWDRGECFIIYKEIEEYTKATPDQIKKCLAFFRERGMVSTTRSTRGVTLKIPKYDYYQTLDNYYYDIKSTTDSTREALEKHQRSTPINKNVKNDKNDKNKTILHTEQSSEINPLLGLFKEVNPSYQNLYARKPQRAAIKRMLKRFTIQQLSVIIKSLPTSNKEQYAPTVTTPCQLEDKLGQLKAFWDKRKANKPKFTKIS